MNYKTEVTVNLIVWVLIPMLGAMGVMGVVKVLLDKGHFKGLKTYLDRLFWIDEV